MKTEQKKKKRTYKGIKSILNHHIKNNIKSLWTYENDNFTHIYENYSGDSRIYTTHQMIRYIDKLILEENNND